MRRAVFLDRDGVLNAAIVENGKPYPPASLAGLQILPGVEQALLRLRNAGLLSVVVTNQPDVATGKQRKEAVEAMNAYLRDKLALDDIRVCYHTEAQDCACRKPRPGMLLAAAQDLDIDLSQSFMIGDRWRDIGAGNAAGCACYFIDYGYREPLPEGPYVQVESLLEAAGLILSRSPPRE